MKIVVGGDFFLSENYDHSMLLSQRLISIFQEADLGILNLEGPITNNTKKIKKTGPNIKNSSNCIYLLKDLNIKLLTLANNHIMDYGEEGLLETIQILTNYGFNVVGAGKNLIDATIPFIYENLKEKIIILNFAENEWASAEQKCAGANPINIVQNVKQIQTAKNSGGLVVCIIHGGSEYVQIPSPRIVEQYRFYVDNGADAIICHHSHCISGYELYKNVPIFYGIGNFLFSTSSNKEEWYKGMIIELDIMNNKIENFNFHFIEQNKHSHRTDLVSNTSLDQKMLYLNTIIKDDSLLESHWKKIVSNHKKSYFSLISGMNSYHPLVRKVLIKIGIPKIIFNDKKRRLLLNLIRCESHHDMLVKILETKNDNCNT